MEKKLGFTKESANKCLTKIKKHLLKNLKFLLQKSRY